MWPGALVEVTANGITNCFMQRGFVVGFGEDRCVECPGQQSALVGIGDEEHNLRA